MNLSNEVMCVFERIGMMKENNMGDLVAVDMRLKPGLHVYATTKDLHYVPTNGRIFSILRSSVNLKVCDYAMSARYLTPYNAMVDKRAKVLFNANQKDGKLEAKIEHVANTKIKSNRKALLRENKNAKNGSDYDSVIVSITEMVSYILEMKRVCCLEKFVNIPTLALEDRGGYLKKAVRKIGDINRAILYVNEDRSSPYPAGTDYGVRFGAIEGRNNVEGFPEWRKLRRMQEIMLYDQCFSSVTVDNMTSFSLRPPELLFVDSPVDYLSWFFWDKKGLRAVRNKGVLVSITEQHVKMNAYESLWIDCLERRVYVHKGAIEKVIDKYVYSMNDEMKVIFYFLQLMFGGEPLFIYDNDGITEMMKDIVVSDYSLESMSRQFTHERDTEDKVPIPIWPCIKPKRVHKFLVHLVLSLGRFETEMDLWNAGSIAEVFYNAKLLPRNPLEEGLPTQDEVDLIIKKYVDQQLFYTPCSKSDLQKFVMSAEEILCRSLMENFVIDFGMSSCLYTSLYYDMNEKYNDYLVILKEELVNKI